MTTNRLFVVVSRFPVFLDQKSYKAQNKLENRMTNECFELEGYDIKTNNVKKTEPDFQREMQGLPASDTDYYRPPEDRHSHLLTKTWPESNNETEFINFLQFLHSGSEHCNDNQPNQTNCAWPLAT